MIFQTKIAESFKAFSDQIAIENGSESITCKQVSDTADSIGTYLLKQGFGKETIIGICLKSRIHIIYSMIGIANAGCVFVPIDMDVPDKVLNAILNDLKPECIISEKGCTAFGNRNLSFQPVVYFIEDILSDDSPVAQKEINWPVYSEEDSLYIYYTSGTTGNPKGIIGKNCSLIHFMEWEINAFNITPGFRFSQLISPYFDAFLRDVFVPLLSGGTICIPVQDENYFSEEKLVSFINDSRITLIHCVPSVFRVFNSRLITENIFLALRYVLLSGERIMPAELRKWYDVFGSRIQLVNLYGATETTLIRSYYLIKPEDVDKPRISIGTPIDDTQLLVANKNLKPCDFLEPGDLYIVSDYISKGYLNAPELTNSRFIKISLNGEEKVAFKTGDKARVFPGGEIDLMGREDRQVKVRGIRIELEEIEQVIIQSGHVSGTVVIKHSDENANEMLIAFLIKKDRELQGEYVINKVQAYLNSCLPSYMVPADIIELDQFPLLRNGKINYNRLTEYLRIENNIIQPVNDTERRLLLLWKEILGEKAVGTEDVFYKVGGNSLSIMRLISLIYREFSVRVPLSDLFTHATIKKQSDLILRSVKDNVLQIPGALARPFYNVSIAQERLYYHYVIDKGNLSYNLPVIWEMDNADESKIEDVIRQLIRRHEGLRTAFRLENGQILQKIQDNCDFKLSRIKNSDPDIHKAIAECIKPFDLEKPPLIRVFILETPGHKPLLIADIPHIVCDGISQMILHTEFVKLYNGEELNAPEVQPKDYAEWENGFRAGKEYLIHREFWLRNFEGGIPEFRLPTTYSGKAGSVEQGGNVSFSITKNVIKDIIQQLSAGDVTDSSVLFSLYCLFLSQLTGQDDMVVAIATSGRIQHELEGAVGMFAKTLPVRCRIMPVLAFSEFATGMHNYLLQAYNNQLYDLADMIEAMGLQNAAERLLFNTMFVFHNFSATKLYNANKFNQYEFESNKAKYAISLIVSEHENSYNFRLEYSSLYFTKADAELLVNRFEQLVTSYSLEPHARIMDGGARSRPEIGINEKDILFNF